MATIRVAQLCTDRYKVETRGHALLTDRQRADAAEAGPTPVELLVMSVATSAADHAERYLRERGLAHDDLRVECSWAAQGEPGRVTRIELSLTPSIRLSPEDHAGMLAAVDGGSVRNTLRQPPVVEVIPLRE